MMNLVVGATKLDDTVFPVPFFLKQAVDFVVHVTDLVFAKTSCYG